MRARKIPVSRADTRSRVIEILRRTPATARDLALQLGLSYGAVRLHLLSLERAGTIMLIGYVVALAGPRVRARGHFALRAVDGVHGAAKIRRRRIRAASPRRLPGGELHRARAAKRRH